MFLAMKSSKQDYTWMTFVWNIFLNTEQFVFEATQLFQQYKKYIPHTLYNGLTAGHTCNS